MPSSLTSFHSFTLGYSPYPPVSVYGTDAVQTPNRSFSCMSTPENLEIGLPRIPRTPVSACAYAVGRPSTKPLSLRYTVPSVVITLERRGWNVRQLSIDYAFGASP